jgi:Tol biopolymer transport system component
VRGLLIKKKVFPGLASLLTVALLVGCGGMPQEDYDKAVADKEAAEAQVASLQSQLDTAKSDASKAKSDLAAAQSELAQVQSDLEAAQNEAASVKGAASPAQSQLSAARAEATKAKSDLAAAHAKVAELEAKVAELEAAAPGEGAAEEANMGNTVNLVSTGESRKLPERLLGLQAVPLYERLVDDPAKVLIAREMAPAYVRFPGGMVGNYYNWRTGQLEFDVQPNSSATYRFFASAADQIRLLHPEGVFIEPYQEFSKSIGAETVLLVNLETSSVADQMEWFEKMKGEGILPRYLELGNEFWLAMLGDPNVLSKWPDVQTTMRVMKEYRDALEPYFIDGTKVAVQLPATRFYAMNRDGKLVASTYFEPWDDYIQPESWFDAVTLHLYPEADSIVGAGEKAKLPSNMDKTFPAMMARCNQGVDETLSAVEKQLPGKEIWITEWSGYAWGGASSDQTPPVLGLHLHLTTRMLMTFLRHSSVTMTHYHMLNFSGGPMSLYRYDSGSGSYVPISSAVILKWFNQAANGGTTYERFRVEGARWITSTVTSEEGYYDIEAVQFQKGESTTTIIVHNASSEVKRLPVSRLVSGRLPTKIESAVVVPTYDYLSSAPPLLEIEPAEEIEIPAYSVTRMVWEQLEMGNDRFSGRPIKEITTLIDSRAKTLAWSPSLNKLTIEKYGSDNYVDIYVINPDGSGEQSLTSNKVGCPQKHNGNSAWHPSGQYIVFTAEKDDNPKSYWRQAVPGSGYNCDLWIMSADGQRFYQLTNYPLNTRAVIHPHFSHDGTRLFWAERLGSSVGTEWGQWALKIADFVIENGIPSIENVKIYQPGQHKYFYESHCFSPDDSKIIFTSNMDNQSDVGFDIYSMDLITGEVINLTNTPNDWDEHGQISPDGKKIVWISSTGLNVPPNTIKVKEFEKNLATEFWIMDANGSNKQRLTYFNTPGYAEYMNGNRTIASDITWSPDSKTIAVLVAYEDGPSLKSKILLIQLR